jgi:hypothetical protein
MASLKQLSGLFSATVVFWNVTTPLFRMPPPAQQPVVVRLLAIVLFTSVSVPC